MEEQKMSTYKQEITTANVELIKRLIAINHDVEIGLINQDLGSHIIDRSIITWPDLDLHNIQIFGFVLYFSNKKEYLAIYGKSDEHPSKGLLFNRETSAIPSNILDLFYTNLYYPILYQNIMYLKSKHYCYNANGYHKMYVSCNAELTEDCVSKMESFNTRYNSCETQEEKERGIVIISANKSKKKKKQYPPKPVKLQAKSKRSHEVKYDKKSTNTNPFKEGKVKEPKLGNVCVRFGKELNAEIRRLPKPEATILVETNPEYSYVSKREWKEWKRDQSLIEVPSSSRSSRRGSKPKGIPGHRLLQRSFATKELPRREEIVKFGKGTEYEQDITIVRAAKKIVKSFKEFNISKSKLFSEVHAKSHGYVTTLAKYDYRLIGNDDSITKSQAETWINTDNKDKAKALLEGKIKTKQGDKIKEVIVDIKELIPMKKRTDKFYPVDICTVTVTFPDNPELQTLKFSKKGPASTTDKWKKELSEWLDKKYSNIHHFIDSSYKHVATSARLIKDNTSATKKVEFEKVEIPVIPKPKWYRKKESVKKEDGSVETSITYSPLTSISIFKRKKQIKSEKSDKKKTWVCPIREKPKKLNSLNNKPKIGLKIK